MATKGSAACFAAKRPDHLHSEGRRWPPKGQQQILQQRDQITYPLKAGDGHQMVSSMFCSRDHITYFLMAGDGHQRSAAGFAAKRPDHLPTESKRWPPKGQ